MDQIMRDRLIKEKKLSIKPIIISIIVLLSIIIAAILIPHKELILTESSINSIIEALITPSAKDYIYLENIEGNNKFLGLTLTDERYSGNEHTYYCIYDVKDKEAIHTLTSSDNKYSVYLKDASIVKYINKNMFIIIDVNGNIFSYNPNDSESLTFINKSEFIKKSRISDDVYIDDTLYILSRRYSTNFNEIALDENALTTIVINKNGDISIEEESLEDDIFTYSFIINTKGEVGILKSSILSVYKDVIASYRSDTDVKYLADKSSLDNYGRFIDTDNIYIDFIKSGETYKVETDLLNITYTYLFTQINSIYGKDTGLVSNVPVIIGDNSSLYINTNYDNYLYDSNIFNSSELSLIASGTLKSDNLNIFTNTNIKYCNHKKYIAFIKTNDGYYSVDKELNINRFSDSPMIYLDNTSLIYKDNKNFYIKY